MQARRAMISITKSSRLPSRTTPAVVCRILIVEDDQETRRLYAMAFESAGYDVASAISVEEAMRHLRARHFDFLLSDYSLADGTGANVIERADAEKLLVGTSTMICTSHPWVHVPAGVRVVHKPIGYDDLLDAVAGQLARRSVTAPHLPKSSHRIHEAAEAVQEIAVKVVNAAQETAQKMFDGAK
jgi:DNA-binding NtrC family response regulator